MLDSHCTSRYVEVHYISVPPSWYPHQATTRSKGPTPQTQIKKADHVPETRLNNQISINVTNNKPTTLPTNRTTFMAVETAAPRHLGTGHCSRGIFLELKRSVDARQRPYSTSCIPGNDGRSGHCPKGNGGTMVDSLQEIFRSHSSIQ